MTDLLAGADQPPQPPKEFLNELVGEGKKFKSPEELARGKWEADRFIEQKNKAFDDLSADYLKLREEYNASQQLKDLINQINTQKPPASSEQPLSNEGNMTAFDPKELKNIVSSEYQAYKQQEKEESNSKLIEGKLMERYGENYPSVLKQEMSRLGMDAKSTNDLARSNPNLFIRAFGLDTPAPREGFQAPPNSSDQRGFTPQVQKRTWSYYQNMKKNDPKGYLNPKTQVQMHDDAIALGAAFEDGNWSTL